MTRSDLKGLPFEILERVYQRVLKNSPICKETSECLKMISDLMTESHKK